MLNEYCPVVWKRMGHLMFGEESGGCSGKECLMSLKTSLIRVNRAVLDTPEEISECLLLPTTFLRMTPWQGKVNVKVSIYSHSFLFWKWVITVSSYCTFCSFRIHSLPAFWTFVMYLLVFDISITYISYICFFAYCLFCSIDKHHWTKTCSYFRYSIFHWCCLGRCLACIRCSWNVCWMSHESMEGVTSHCLLPLLALGKLLQCPSTVPIHGSFQARQF